MSSAGSSERPRREHPKIDSFMQRLLSFTFVQQLLSNYDWWKHSCSNVEHTLERVEQAIKLAYERTLDLYDEYCSSTVDGVYQDYNRRVVETTQRAKSLGERLLTLGFGATLVVIQLSVTVSLAAINMVFSALLSGRDSFGSVLEHARRLESTVVHWLDILFGYFRSFSKESTDSLARNVKVVLDKANTFAEGRFGVSPEGDSADKTTIDRVKDLGVRVSDSLKNKAHCDVINPVYKELQRVLERLSSSLLLLDKVREHKTWAFEKVDELQGTVLGLKKDIEEEAEKLKENPDETLMTYLRQNSTRLFEMLNTLKERSGKVFGESSERKLETIISHLEEFDKNLGEANNIHEVRDEVLSIARDRLIDLVQWTTTWLLECNAASSTTGGVEVSSQ